MYWVVQRIVKYDLCVNKFFVKLEISIEFMIYSQ